MKIELTTRERDGSGFLFTAESQSDAFKLGEICTRIRGWWMTGGGSVPLEVFFPKDEMMYYLVNPNYLKDDQ